MTTKTPTSQRWNAFDLAALALGLALFLGLATYQLHLPGLHYDEAIEVVPAMQLLTGQPVEAFRDAGVHLGEILLPLMVMDYIGAMNTYLALPFFALFGIDVFAIRLMPIVFSSITLILVYLFTRQLFGRLSACLAMWLLAAGISFVFWSRQGVFVTNLTATLMMGMMLGGLQWWRSRRSRHLYLAAFLAGLGLYTKFIFLWAIIGILGAIVIVNGDRLLAFLREDGSVLKRAGALLSKAQCLITPACFLLGLSPLIVFNIQTAGTVHVLTENLTTSYYGVDNLAFGQNLIARVDQFLTVLKGDHFWYLGETYRNLAWPPALAGSFLLVLFLALGRRKSGNEGWREALFPFVMLGLIILQSCFTISALWFTHFAMITPLPAIALAGALGFFGRHARMAWPPRVITAILLVVLLILDVQADLRYHRILSLSGGYAAHSDAVYRLVEHLDEVTDTPVVALDWGIKPQVQLLTLGKVGPVEVFGYESLDSPDEGFPERIRPYFDHPETIYIGLSRELEIFRGRGDALHMIAGAAGLQSHIQYVIYERSGRPAFVMISVE